MRRSRSGSLLAAILLAALAPQATATLPIDWVTVDDPDNPADPATGSMFGSVSEPYRIGKYEVTNAQYAAFLNAVDPEGRNGHGLYSPNMANDYGGIIHDAEAPAGTRYAVIAGREKKPVVYVTWFDAARMANWMHNGQGNGDTETGAYNLNGATSGLFTKISRARVWIPSEDEWYKAAYYDPTRGAGGGDHYWFYPTRSDSEPSNDLIDPDPGNNATFRQRGSTTYFAPFTTDAGAHENSSSYYGTFDQAGNVQEWTDGVVGDSQRSLRGGWWDQTSTWMESLKQASAPPGFRNFNFGFRLATVPGPNKVIVPTLTVDEATGTALSCSLTGRANADYAIMSSQDIDSDFNTPEMTNPATVSTDASGKASFTLTTGGRSKLFLQAREQP